jgi:hypothetical protein
MAARVRGLLVLSAVAATLLAGVIAGPGAQAQTATCTAPTATLTVSPNSVSPGGTITVTAANFTPNTPIYFFDNGQAISSANADASGGYTVTGPASGAAGQHTLVGSQNSGRCATTTYTIGNGTATTAGTCPAGYTQSGTQCVSTTSYAGTCPAGYTQSGAQCVPAGAGVCPTGYYFDGTQCRAGSYPGTYPGAYPGSYGGQGRCPSGYVDIGYACQPGPYASAYCPPGGTYPPGSGCAAAQASSPTTPYATTATTVVQSAPQAVASGRVAYTGSRTTHSVALGLALLLGGLVLLSARAVRAPFRR